MKFLFVFFLLLICKIGVSQQIKSELNDIKFTNYTLSMLNGDYRLAINQILSKKIETLSKEELYNLSCSYLKSNFVDSSIFYLKILLTKYRIDPYFAGDVTFMKIWGLDEWNKLLRVANDKYLLENINLFHPQIEFDLQKFKGEDQSSISLDSNIFRRLHFVHITYINEIINNSEIFYKISKNGLEAILLFVIHENDLNIQKKYLGVFKKLANKSMVEWEDVCILEDKILIKDGKKQIYGTQWYYDLNTKKSEPYPIKNIRNIEKRRQSKKFDFSFKQYSDFQNIE
jgi:hypothetical protein